MKVMTPFTLDKAITNDGLSEHRSQAQIIIDRINSFFKDITLKKPGIPNQYIDDIKNNGHASMSMDNDFYFTVGFANAHYIVEAVHVVFFEDPEDVIPVVHDAFQEAGWAVSESKVVEIGEGDPIHRLKFVRVVAYMDKDKIPKSGR